ncbi:hypothetical protein Tco_1220437 [Tanacetum coccineum]
MPPFLKVQKNSVPRAFPRAAVRRLDGSRKSTSIRIIVSTKFWVNTLYNRRVFSSNGALVGDLRNLENSCLLSLSFNFNLGRCSSNRKTATVLPSQRFEFFPNSSFSLRLHHFLLMEIGIDALGTGATTGATWAQDFDYETEFEQLGGWTSSVPPYISRMHRVLYIQSKFAIWDLQVFDLGFCTVSQHCNHQAVTDLSKSVFDTPSCLRVAGLPCEELLVELTGGRINLTLVKLFPHVSIEKVIFSSIEIVLTLMLHEDSEWRKNQEVEFDLRPTRVANQT